MIRHILLFSLKPDVPAAAGEAMLAELARFPEKYDQIRDWQMGGNQSERDDTYDHGVTMTFADRAGLDAYLRCEAHEAFVRDRFRPMIACRAIVTFELP